MLTIKTPKRQCLAPGGVRNLCMARGVSRRLVFRPLSLHLSHLLIQFHRPHSLIGWPASRPASNCVTTWAIPCNDYAPILELKVLVVKQRTTALPLDGVAMWIWLHPCLRRVWHTVLTAYKLFGGMHAVWNLSCLRSLHLWACTARSLSAPTESVYQGHAQTDTDSVVAVSRGLLQQLQLGIRQCCHGLW